ncbi:MAG: DUF1326 domain-containing protein [Gemmatimonadota bacterium]
MVRGVEYGNCNCAWGCPCQFGSPTTNGNCEAVLSGIIDEGYHGDTRLDGLKWAMLVYWPGEIAEGNGRQQVIIAESATDAQRESLRRILHGEDTEPGATHFFVYNSTMAEVLDTLYLPIEVSIDVDGRSGRLSIPGVVESTGTPITDPISGAQARSQIRLPNGFEYTVAEMGSGTTKSQGAIALDLTDSYGQFNVLHMNQDGVIR